MMAEQYYNFKLGLANKGRLVTLDELNKMTINPDQDAYLSIFSYSTEQKNKIDKLGSVSGISDVVTNTLIWDFDSVDPENARKDVIKLAEKLVAEYNVEPDSIQCFWSGNKGFHVVVPIVQTITPEQFKKATTELAKDLETFDPVVSDPARVLRLEFTKHPKTGLYKVPFSIVEIDELTIAQIKEQAKEQKDNITFDTTPVKLPETLFKILEKKKLELVENNTMTNPDFDYSSPPKGWKKYKWALAQGWFESGERHSALMIIAATCRALGFSKDHAYYICKTALKKQSSRTGSAEFDKSELWENIIEQSVFSDKWEGGQYSIKNNPWLQKYCKTMGFDTKDTEEVNITQLHNIQEEFVDFVKNIDKNTILTGIPELDKALPLTVGMNLGIIGAASSGKTALALKILKNTSDAGVISVFASLDMRRNRLFEKLLYRVSGLSREQLYTKIKEDKADDIFEEVKKQYANVFFYDRSCPTVEDIREYINKIEEQTGKKVKLVMIDYFERVNADRSDDTAASKEVAGKLQDLVNDMNVCLITLVQPNKFSLSGGPDSPILNYTAIKGSSFLYQSFRSIISIWRPFFTPETKNDDKYLQMAILKNDLGELDIFNFGWEGKRGEIWGLGEEGDYELERLLTIKENSKKNIKSESDWS